jgi:ABC-type sugar transport system, periplasmic component
MRNKLQEVRAHVLDMLERGELDAGDQIPAARDLAAELGISFLKVQQAIESLCRDGVLESVSRKGTFVQTGWRDRILPENLSVYDEIHRMPWLKDMLEVARKDFPELRMSHLFRKSMLELKVPRHVLTEPDGYMDLRDILNECYPDRSMFFEKMFPPFEVAGRVVGVPFAMSPRVVFFNPELFRAAGCKLPRAGWEWSDFLACLRKLKRLLPRNRLINWHTHSFLWMNFVFRAGGRLFDPSAKDPVCVDSPATLEGLRRFSELGDLLGRVPYDDDAFHQAFCAGEAAMLIADRKQVDFCRRAGFDGWDVAPLPLFPNGRDVTAQATDLICVRKDFTSRAMAVRYVRVMLSETIQNFLAQQRSGIPIRKKAAYESLDLTDPRDAVFAAEMGKMTADFGIAPPFPGSLVITGIEQLLARNLDLEAGLKELARAARTALNIAASDADGISAPGSVFSRPRKG